MPMTAIRPTVPALLEGNRRWAEKIEQDDPTFFTRLADGQQPPFLYIGCADSRVPPDHFTSSNPGSLFVTRNIANQIQPGDLAMRGVVEYAVGVLKIKHVIVCGHTGCGGVLAAMSNEPLGGALGEWLRPLKQLVEASESELAKLEGTARVNRMVERNVEAQARSLAAFDAIRNAWNSGSPVSIHGWVFDLTNGRVREVVCLEAENQR